MISIRICRLEWSHDKVKIYSYKRISLTEVNVNNHYNDEDILIYIKDDSYINKLYSDELKYIFLIIKHIII